MLQPITREQLTQEGIDRYRGSITPFQSGGRKPQNLVAYINELHSDAKIPTRFSTLLEVLTPYIAIKERDSNRFHGPTWLGNLSYPEDNETKDAYVERVLKIVADTNLRLVFDGKTRFDSPLFISGEPTKQFGFVLFSSGTPGEMGYRMQMIVPDGSVQTKWRVIELPMMAKLGLHKTFFGDQEPDLGVDEVLIDSEIAYLMSKGKVVGEFNAKFVDLGLTDVSSEELEAEEDELAAMKASAPEPESPAPKTRRKKAE